MRARDVSLLGFLLLPVACRSQPSLPGTLQATSLLGKPLHQPVLEDAVYSDRAEKLARAEAAYLADPDDEDAAIWVGRRLAYLGRYREAVDVFTEALARHPQSHRLRRHRGHRYITLRRFDDAVRELGEAARLAEDVPDRIEPDGLPNASNVPLSTTHSNIYYHLGLAHYLRGDFAAATEAYWRCLAFSKNDDMQCATRYWLYLSLARQGRDAEARSVLSPVHPDMRIIENFGYHRLLLLFRGNAGPEELGDGEDAIADATTAYGLGAWHLLNGRGAEAQRVFRRVADGPAWAAFGAIAAEAELARGE